MNLYLKQKVKKMKFEEVLPALCQGKKIKRKHWPAGISLSIIDIKASIRQLEHDDYDWEVVHEEPVYEYKIIFKNRQTDEYEMSTGHYIDEDEWSKYKTSYNTLKNRFIFIEFYQPSKRIRRG
jgi:hypothetical protein